MDFVQVTGPDAIRVRTCERGIEDETDGGPLTITLGDATIMTGPAATAFEGVVAR